MTRGHTVASSCLAFLASSTAALITISPAPAQVPSGTDGFLRFPDTNGHEVAFASEGDLWVAPIGGGIARRLTTDEGEERFAHFSPDAASIAFSGFYGGNMDVFVVPAEGGVPKRLARHPAQDQVVGWTPDGQVLFRGRRDDAQQDWRLYKIMPAGGDPEPLPLRQAALASFSSDGGRIAFDRFSLEWHHWNQCQGAWAKDIYMGNLANLDSKQITDYKGMDAFPMWHGDRIYFLSDRDGIDNLYRMTRDGADVRRLTSQKEADIRPSKRWRMIPMPATINGSRTSALMLMRRPPAGSAMSLCSIWTRRGSSRSAGSSFRHSKGKG